MRKFSIVIPVYNRPDEIKELLESLSKQSYKNFEVIIVEDGSEKTCEEIVHSFQSKIDVSYHFKINSGQGFSRNFGFDLAKGDYYIVFDSDCIIPEHYLSIVDKSLTEDYVDAYGGPDASHYSFTDIQKAINYSMTSFFTTGGIRGRKKMLSKFHPRSFNMGISREVFEKTKGYIITRMGEDIEFSIRIINAGYKTKLIPEAYVYHKRRTNLKAFFKQLHFFGRARINVYRFFPKELKPVHFFPACFTLFFISTLVFLFVNIEMFGVFSVLLSLYAMLILIDSSVKNNSLKVGVLSVFASFTQLVGYGLGFIEELYKEISGTKDVK